MRRALLAVFLVCPLAAPRAQAGAKPPPYPVLFAHGLSSNDLTWQKTVEYLEDRGWGVPYTYHTGLNVSVSTHYADDVVMAAPGEPEGAGAAVRVDRNPARGPVAAIEWTLPRAGAAGYRVQDALGRVVVERDPVALPPGVQRATLDTAPLAPGVYVLQATVDGGALAPVPFSVVR